MPFSHHRNPFKICIQEPQEPAISVHYRLCMTVSSWCVPGRMSETQEAVANSGYNSGDETSSLLVRVPTKPVLMRQDCTTTLAVHPNPHLSHSAVLMGHSDESACMPVLLEETARSVPDIELHCRADFR